MRRKWVLALGSLLFSLLVLEVVARVRWTEPWYQRLRLEQEENQRIRYARNRWKLRDQDYPSPKPAGRQRIMVLGDSFTFGLGVKDEEKVFCSLLEQQLEPTGTAAGVDVLNAGISGSLPVRWVEVWEEVAPEFQPDVMLIVFFLRDGTDFGVEAQYFDQIRQQVAESNHDRLLYRCSYLYRMYQDVQDRKKIGADYEEKLHQAYFGDREVSRQWRVARRNLKKLQAQAQAAGIPVGLVVFPILVELDPDTYPFAEEVAAVRRFGRSNGFATFDLLPAFLGHEAADLWVSPGDQHPNARGHEIAANALLPFVTTLLEQAVTDPPDPPTDDGGP